MSYWPGFLSLQLLRQRYRRREERHKNTKGAFQGQKLRAAAKFTPRWHLGAARAEQNRREPLPAGAFLFRTTIRQFQLKPPRISPEPGSTIALALGCLFCFVLFCFSHTIYKFVCTTLEALPRSGVCGDTCIQPRCPLRFFTPRLRQALSLCR